MMMADDTFAVFTLSAPPATSGERGDHVALNPDDMAARGWRDGDCVMVTAVARAAGRLVAHKDIARGHLALTPMLGAATGLGTVAAAGAGTGAVTLEAAQPTPATRIVFGVVDRAPPAKGGALARFFGVEDSGARAALPVPDMQTLKDRVLMRGSLIEQDGACLRVIEAEPSAPALVDSQTSVSVVDPLNRRVSYQDVGGLSTEIARIREMVELPLRRPEIFAQLGVEAPRGLLLYGPPGCGKTLIARAIAQQTDAVFLSINGPEVIQKHYGESEEVLRKVFEEAQKHPATILFIDEIDALVPNRETVLGEVEKRVVGQLLALMDGVTSRGKVVVMAATNLPNAVDPALRRPGRFDREISINPPTKAGRREILDIHTRFMPLSADVDLERVAAVTHGFLGADLAALCREAGMASARDSQRGDTRAPLFVTMAHFQDALASFRLSTIRELSTDIAETQWDDIGGLAAEKRLLQQAIDWPLLYGARFRHADAHAPKGILLTGGSGTGKTLLAQAVGTTTEVNFIVARGPELLSKWVGESERGIRDVFRRARQSAPSILFFDELDAIAPTRGESTGDGQIGDRMVGQFLLELDAIDGSSGVVVLAATNRPDIIDQALLRPGRFDLVIDLPEPDRDARLAILKVHCQNAPLDGDVDLARIAEATQGLNGADLAALCQRAKLQAIAASIETRQGQDFAPFPISAVHFDAALKAVRHSKYPNENRR